MDKLMSEAIKAGMSFWYDADNKTFVYGSFRIAYSDSTHLYTVTNIRKLSWSDASYSCTAALMMVTRD